MTVKYPGNIDEFTIREDIAPFGPAVDGKVTPSTEVVDPASASLPCEQLADVFPAIGFFGHDVQVSGWLTEVFDCDSIC